MPRRRPITRQPLPVPLWIPGLLVTGHWLGAAPYTYVDATPANTTLDGAPLVAGANYVNDGGTDSATDRLWTFRTDSGAATFEGGNYFESDNASASGDREATGNLVTTITLDDPGTHDIVVIFSRTLNRDIAARIGAAPDSSHMFTISNSWNADADDHPRAIGFDATWANTRGGNSGAAYLGQVTTTTAGQAVSIHINGFDSLSGTQDERTQYEGIAHRPAAPPAPRHRDVFLIAGQSNADGRGLKSDLIGNLTAYAGQQPAVLLHYTNPGYTHADQGRHRQWRPLETGFSVPPGFSAALPSTTFGVEIAAAKVLSSHYPNPAIIKVSRGGTALGVPGTDWYPAPLDSPDAGPLYKALIESTRLALDEIEAAGDSHKVHALFWHQGESDGSRTGQYGALLATLIESVRRDLSLPNLRFVIGELAETKAQSFRDAQWQASRTLPNTGFISSRALSTSDDTHFNAASMIVLGARLGHSLLPDRAMLDFEAPVHGLGALDRQDEWSASIGTASPLAVVATTAQGEYPGGQAAGHTGTSGAHPFNRRHVLPLAGARTMQADFFPGDAGYDNEADADSSLLVAGWGTDAGNDGIFTDSESAIGLGLDASGAFRIQVGAQAHLAGGFTYQTDRWYRLTLQWSEPGPDGRRAVGLFVRDLAAGADLNGGAAVLVIEVPATAFDGQHQRWSGVGCRATRGLIDNIRITPPGFDSWQQTFHPTLNGGRNGDDDLDGIPNLIEFAFGLDPLHPDSATALPQPVFGSGTGTFRFKPLAAQPGILHEIEWSTDLTSWNRLGGTRLGDEIEFTLQPPPGTSVFVRHRVGVEP